MRSVCRSYAAVRSSIVTPVELTPDLEAAGAVRRVTMSYLSILMPV